MATCSTVYQVPGPRGPQGAAGTNGTDGTNAFSNATNGFTVPSGVNLTTTTTFEADNVDAFVTMAAAHNLTTGALVDLSGFSVGGFNLTDVAVTVLSATQFSYPAPGLLQAPVLDGTGAVGNIRLPVTFDNNDWVIIGQFLEVTSIGTFEVTGLNGTETYLKNAYDGTAGSYPNNAAAGTAVAAGTRVGPSGMQGPGATGAQGFQGTQGNQGNAGLDGLDGGIGPQGVQGAQGTQGASSAAVVGKVNKGGVAQAAIFPGNQITFGTVEFDPDNIVAAGSHGFTPSTDGVWRVSCYLVITTVTGGGTGPYTFGIYQGGILGTLLAKMTTPLTLNYPPEQIYIDTVVDITAAAGDLEVFCISNGTSLTVALDGAAVYAWFSAELVR